MIHTKEEKMKNIDIILFIINIFITLYLFIYGDIFFFLAGVIDLFLLFIIVWRR